MNKINRILVPCDFSQYSGQVLEFAAGITEQMSAGLIVANVLNQREVETIRAAIGPIDMIKQTIYLDEFISKTKESRLQKIQKLVEDTSSSDVVIKKLIRVGAPYQELIQTVKDENIDLVIMGTKGRSNLPGVLMGSTAEKMFRHCSVPLLSVRPNH